MNCKAYKLPTGDFVCDRCTLQWDKDDDPPECRPEIAPRASDRVYSRSIKRIRNCLKTDH